MGYVGMYDVRDCHVTTKTTVAANAHRTGEDARIRRWQGADWNQHWRNSYAREYMGEPGGDSDAAFHCPSGIRERKGWPYDGSFRQEQAYARFIGAGNSGYAMTAWCWDWVVTIPVPGGKWMYNENWSPWDARKIPRAYVRGLKAVSKLIAFADYSVDNGYGGLNWGEGGFRHDKGGKFEDWWKNMVFWDGHVGEYEIDTGKSEYWNDTDE